jgi:hypothetical protein
LARPGAAGYWSWRTEGERSPSTTSQSRSRTNCRATSCDRSGTGALLDDPECDNPWINQFGRFCRPDSVVPCRKET